MLTLILAVASMLGTVTYAYRLANDAYRSHASDATGYVLFALLGALTAGLLIAPAALGGLLAGYANSENAEHPLVAEIAGGIMLLAVPALLFLG